MSCCKTVIVSLGVFFLSRKEYVDLYLNAISSTRRYEQGQLLHLSTGQMDLISMFSNKNIWSRWVAKWTYSSFRPLPLNPPPIHPQPTPTPADALASTPGHRCIVHYRRSRAIFIHDIWPSDAICQWPNFSIWFMNNFSIFYILFFARVAWRTTRAIIYCFYCRVRARMFAF